MPPEDHKDKLREAIANEQRLVRMESKLDTVLEYIGPNGEIHRRVGVVEEDVKNMKRGAVATIVTMFLSVISFIGIWLWNKITGTH